VRSGKVGSWFGLVISLVICMLVTNDVQSEPLRVGVFSGPEAMAVKSIQAELEANGYATAIITISRNNDEFAAIYDCDVLFFGGGWGCYDWIPASDRVHLVEFVEQRGGGVIFSMFRCGTTARAIIRPLFPDVADGYNKVNSRGIIVTDVAHPIMQGLPREFLLPFWDHAVMRLGPQGRVLAVDTGGEVSIACGNAGLGRAVFLGPWIGEGDDKPLSETDKLLLLNSVAWAGASKFRNKSAERTPSEAAQLKVLRRELMLDWTHDGRGKSYAAGLLARARNCREQELDDMYHRLSRYTVIAGSSGQAEAIMNLQKAITALQKDLYANYAQAARAKELEISRMPLEQLKREPIRDFWHIRNAKKIAEDQATIVEEWRCRLLFPHQVDPVAAAVCELETRLEPELEKYQAAKIAAERTEDARSLAPLKEQLLSGDAAARYAAALELARIGDASTVPVLIKALSDTDYRVRRSAIYGLSWMQSREAVPALMKLLQSSEDVWMRRRAAQALGQIGDAQALECLLAAAWNDADAHVRNNAILSLGWLGDSGAVSPLLEIAGQALQGALDGDKNQGAQRACSMTLSCAIRALGSIGDSRALPFLERKDIPEFPAAYRSPDVNLAAEAVEAIKTGGRGRQGIEQLDVMRNKEHFYWMEDKYNAIYGRYMYYRCEPKHGEVMLGYAGNSGGSSTVEFNTVDTWKSHSARFPEKGSLDEYFKCAERFGLKVNTQMPTLPQEVNKALFERDIMILARYPAFGGLWLEETVEMDGAIRPEGDEAFRRFLASRYTAKQLAELGLGDLATVTMPKPDGEYLSMHMLYERDGARTNRVVFAEYLEYLSECGVDSWRETQEWTAGLCKGAKLSFSLSSRYEYGGSTFISAYPRINLALDAGGPQSYGEHSARNNFNLDLHVDGESRPAQGEFYAHQADTPGRVERGIASSFVYGQQFFNHCLNFIFKHPAMSNQGTTAFDHGRWEAAIRQFTKGKALSEYLAPRKTRGLGLVTQLYSGRTTTLTYGDGMIDRFSGRGKVASTSPGGYPLRYTQHQIAFRESILRSHLPLEMTWLETQNPEKLAGYKVAILADGVSLDEREEALLREWVKVGGSLIVTASSTLNDKWDRRRENYGLADVFGVDYVSTKGEPSLVYVERDLKPQTGISEIKITDAEYLKHMEAATCAEYEKGIGYDVVKPVGARVVGEWDDGTPAVLEHRYGAGHVIFITACYPALSHQTRDWTVDNLYNEYWSGMRELLAGCVRRGLELAGAELPIEASNCPLTVDVVVKRQEQNRRWMVHLLNMDEKNGLIKDVKIKVKPPYAAKAVYYAYPDRHEVDFVARDGMVEFVVRQFDVHEMIVVEWEP
jgi:hypothetical protein